MKHDVIEGLKRDVQQKSTELVNTKQELESALNRTIEEYEGRLKAMKLEYEAKLSEVQARQVSTKQKKRKIRSI
jgi:predicted component of type VI protein secretion system